MVISDGNNETSESIGVKRIVEVNDKVKSKEFLGFKIHEESLQKNWPILIIIILLALGTPLLGLVFSGLLGIVVGIACNIVTLIIGLDAVEKIIKIERRIEFGLQNDLL